jgi:flagellar FliJ protein
LKKKSERLKVVLEQAERKEQLALEKLTGSRKYLDAQLSQLQGLRGYHQQYLDDMKRNMSGVQDVNHLQSNLKFMAQIDVAIKQQQSVIGVAQKEYDKVLALWTELHQKKKGMSDLIVRYKNDELLINEKKEQKQIEDDLLSRRARVSQPRVKR